MRSPLLTALFCGGILACVFSCRRAAPSSASEASEASVAEAGADASVADASADAGTSPYVTTWAAKYPDDVELVGVDRATGTAFLLQGHGERRGPQKLVAVDLATKQAKTLVELAQLPRVTQLETMRDDGTVKSAGLDGGPLDALGTSALQSELLTLVGVLQRSSGTPRNDRIATSTDGKQMLFNAGDWMYRSHDAGRDLARIDGRAGYEPYVSRDGATGAYEALDPRTQKYGLQVLAMTPKAVPQGLGAAGVELRPRGWGADGHSLFGLRTKGDDDKAGCAVRVDTASTPPRAVTLKCASATSEGTHLLIAPGGAMGALIGSHSEGDKGTLEIEWLSLPGGASAGRANITGMVRPISCAITDSGRIACPCLLDNPSGRGGRDPGLLVVDVGGAKHHSSRTLSVPSVAWLDEHRLAMAWVADGGVLDVIDVEALH